MQIYLTKKGKKMMKKNRFIYKTLEELKSDIEKWNLDCPIDEEPGILQEEIKLRDKVIPNRFAIHPMEGADANLDGTPGELTLRRYQRYANGGAGLIWFEATAVNESGRTNKLQLYINENTVDKFKDMVDMVRKKAHETWDDKLNPYLVLQLTHSGRFGENKNILFHHEL
ncbi:MAG TPA: NADH:flavin oxidoreductase, partial [Halanaerobiales bacterium]|nr:NADH:flavin oxidoreductase [Halanaerobiales bacterium]